MQIDETWSEEYRCSKGQTQLQVAAQFGYASTIEPLLATGVLPDEVDAHENRLDVASHFEQLAVVQQLLNAGANVNHAHPENRATPLIYAARRGNVAIVEALLVAGAAINQMDIDGSTALRSAIEYHRVDVAALLLTAGADMNFPTPFEDGYGDGPHS